MANLSLLTLLLGSNKTAYNLCGRQVEQVSNQAIAGNASFGCFHLECNSQRYQE